MKKQTFAIIIAVIFIAAMFIYKDSMTLLEVMLAFVGMGSTIGFVWKWLTVEEVKKEKKQKRENLVAENRKLRNDLETDKR